MMKKMILVGFTALTVVGSVNAEPRRPVLEAALKATPSQRFEAARFVRSAYPNLAEDVHAQLKAEYPNLERGVVDAGLQTWREHPGEVLALAKEIKTKFGPRLLALRTAVRAEMESSYPDFENRLQSVLSQHGLVGKWMKFMKASNPGLAQRNRAVVNGSVPEASGWYPGKFLKMRLSALDGSNPLFDKLQGIVERDPELLPKLATRLVERVRAESPDLADDWNKQRFANRRQLREALEAEFPGARDKIVAVVEKTDPGLVSEVATFARTRNESLRADFRKNLEAHLPGFEGRAQETVEARYPDLKGQLLAILTGAQ